MPYEFRCWYKAHINTVDKQVRDQVRLEVKDYLRRNDDDSSYAFEKYDNQDWADFLDYVTKYDDPSL